MPDGQSVYDALGSAYTLLCFKQDVSNDVMALQTQAHALGMPLTVLDASGVSDIPPEYKHAFVLVRSDAHTVWRGNSLTPKTAHDVVVKLCGRALT